MKIKFLVSMAGHRHTWNPGEIHDVEPKEAARLIKAGYAVSTEAKPPAPAKPAAPKVEKAVAKTPDRETRGATTRKAKAAPPAEPADPPKADPAAESKD